MAILDREAILQMPDLPTEKVDVPEWGGTILVRGLTGQERDQYDAWITRNVGDDVELVHENKRAKLVVLGCVDEQGNRLFNEADVEALGKKNSQVLERLFEVIARLSGLGVGATKEAVGN